MALFRVTGVLRLRVAWWPIHPVLFLVFDTLAIARFSLSFLIGWAIKAVMQVGGAGGCQQVRPPMVGVIAGELLMVLLWSVVGAIYFFVTGLPPERYAIF